MSRQKEPPWWNFYNIDVFCWCIPSRRISIRPIQKIQSKNSVNSNCFVELPFGCSVSNLNSNGTWDIQNAQILTVFAEVLYGPVEHVGDRPGTIVAVGRLLETRRLRIVRQQPILADKLLVRLKQTPIRLFATYFPIANPLQPLGYPSVGSVIWNTNCPIAI